MPDLGNRRRPRRPETAPRKASRRQEPRHCRIEPYLESSAAPSAPLARRQRRALPWEARAAHAGPHESGTLSEIAQTNTADKARTKPSSSLAVVQLTAAASMAA